MSRVPCALHLSYYNGESEPAEKKSYARRPRKKVQILTTAQHSINARCLYGVWYGNRGRGTMSVLSRARSSRFSLTHACENANAFSL